VYLIESNSIFQRSTSLNFEVYSFFKLSMNFIRPNIERNVCKYTFNLSNYIYSKSDLIQFYTTPTEYSQTSLFFTLTAQQCSKDSVRNQLT